MLWHRGKVSDCSRYKYINKGVYKYISKSCTKTKTCGKVCTEKLAQHIRECKQVFDFSLGEGQSICCDTEVSAQIVLDVTSATDGCPLENRSTHADFANTNTITNTELT